jgi:hypothetical protein
MGCQIFLHALIGPRDALFFTWVLTTYIESANDDVIVPELGFVFLTWTTLVYALSYDGREVSPLGWLFVAIALFVDVSSYGASARSRSR